MANKTTGNTAKKTSSTGKSSSAGSGRRGTGAGKASGSSRTRETAPKKRAEEYLPEEEESFFESGAFIILVLLFLVFILICNFGVLGVVGGFVKKIVFGLFGFVSYILPIAAGCAFMFGIFNKGNSVVTRRILAGTLALILFMIGSDLATGNVNAGKPLDLASIWTRCSTDFNGGGILGGVLCYYLVRFLSNVGTILFIIVGILLCLLIFAGRGFLDNIREQGQLLYEDSVEDHHSRSLDRAEKSKLKKQLQREKIERKRELNEQREQEKRLREEARENDQILRSDNPAKGVTFNTTLEPAVNKTVDEAAIRDDEHIIKVTDSEEYEKRRNNSVLLHEKKVQSGSDAIREITPSGDDGYSWEEPDEYEEPVYESDSYEEESFPVEEEPLKPEASYTPEPGNQMHTEVMKPRPVARPEVKSDPTPAHTAPKKSEAPVNPAPAKPKSTTYKYPSPALLSPGKKSGKGGADKELKDTAELLIRTLETFGVKGRITDVSRGPAVTRYELQPELGVKVSKIVGLSDDLKLALAATDIRIEAPIPGKSAVGIEVPNKENEAVAFRELIESAAFKESKASLPFAVGKDLGGQIVIHDIAKMPHVLIAGATGSGKSVCINTIIMSILYKCKPEDVRLILIDPKVVELSVYNPIPHLLLPVVTDPKKAAGALAWAVKEMEDRYVKFAESSVRDLKGYNAKIEDPSEKLPHILIIVDELADLMMVAPGEVEGHICRLAQLARACGIHLVIATQRPSVDVITGLIKANMPSRIAFAVSSGVDSRTILDMVGAEKLLGKGDMLFYPQGLPKPTRVQGAFVSDGDVSKVVDFFNELAYEPGGAADIDAQVGEVMKNQSSSDSKSGGSGSEYDELFAEAGRFIIDKEKASIGALQRLLKIGFNRAARIMDQLADAGVVGEEQGTKPREILMDQQEFDNLLEELGIN